MAKMDIFAMTDTWNASGTTFDAIKMNVTDTASAAGSLLLNLQVGGSSLFRVGKAGNAIAPISSAATPAYAVGANATGLYSRNATLRLNFAVNGSDAGVEVGPDLFAFASTVQLTWVASTLPNSNPDLILARDAADTLALRRDTNPQTFRIYNTYSGGGANYERANIFWSGGNFNIYTDSAGTGTAKNLQLGTLGSALIQFVTGSTARWQINSVGHILAATDNTYDIGANGANRPRSIFVAGSVTFGTGAFLQSASRFVITGPADGVITISTAATGDFNRLQFGGTTSSFPALKRNGTAINVRLADDSADAPFTSGRATIDTLTVGLGGQTAVADNTALGFQALHSASLTGAGNVGVGYQALFINTTGSDSSALGVAALLFNTTGSRNSAVGRSALLNNTTGNNNSAMGAYALLSNTTGLNNSAMGQYALQSNTTGANNSAMGKDALFSNTTGGSNSATGAFALQNNTTGGSNSAVGVNSLLSNTTGSNSSALGFDALRRFVSAGNQVAIGYRALYGGDATPANNTGTNNIAIGFQAGDAITTGSTNIVIGYDIDVDSATGSNQINIGGVYFHDRLLYTERADPAAPAANQAVVYARDNGAGKTQLCVRFNTGAVQVLATEP